MDCEEGQSIYWVCCCRCCCCCCSISIMVDDVRVRLQRLSSALSSRSSITLGFQIPARRPDRRSQTQGDLGCGGMSPYRMLVLCAMCCLVCGMQQPWLQREAWNVHLEGGRDNAAWKIKLHAGLPKGAWGVLLSNAWTLLHKCCSKGTTCSSQQHFYSSLLKRLAVFVLEDIAGSCAPAHRHSFLLTKGLSWSHILCEKKRNG